MTVTYDSAYVRREEEPVLAPPRSEVGVIGWLRTNLFSSTTNTILTLLGVAFLFWAVPPIVRWAFIDAAWTGSDREACLATEGACWAFVRARFGQFMYGRYPLDERWRVDLTAILLVAGLIPMAIPRVPHKRANMIYLLVVFPIVALILLTGGHFRLSSGFLVAIALLGCVATGIIALFATRHSAPILGGIVAPAGAALTVVGSLAAAVATGFSPGFYQGILLAAAILITLASAVVTVGAGAIAMFMSSGRPGVRLAGGVWLAIAVIAGIFVLITADFDLAPVETSLWGGLLVTLVVAVVGMVASFPIGVLLALGRRSRMPVVRMLSVTFIEFVRGVPLITVLFMASVMLPIFLPPGVTFDKLLRALIGVALFEAAYLAEVVRAGLQAIPRGQYEAAQAMGLTYWQMMRLIILPQALKIVIPGIVNSFISLFKDTSLVLIIGIFDLLGIVQLGFTDANWAAPTTPMTGYIFAGIVFWLFCFGMSRYSIYTERRLSAGRRI